MSNIAARLSAERPSWNALRRSGRGAGFERLSAARHVAPSRLCFLIVFGERQRALINLAPRQAGRIRHFGDGVFERNAGQRLAQQRFGIGRAHRRRRVRRRDDKDDLAARFVCRASLRQRREIAAADFLVQLGEFAAQRRLAVAESGGEIGERCGDARSGLEQNKRRRNAAEFGDAAAPRGFVSAAETRRTRTDRWAVRRRSRPPAPPKRRAAP